MKTKRILFSALAILLAVAMMPMSAFAAIDLDLSVSNDYYQLISNKEYTLAPGITEAEIIVNNKEGNDRKIVHVFEVDTKNPTVQVLPGYYGIDKLDPNNIALEGVADKNQYWSARKLTETVKYYEEELGYNVVGAMNTALSYDSNAPYGYMVWEGVVLGTPEIHPGASTYLAVDWEGNCELRDMTTPLNGTERTAVSANFQWLVKDGVSLSKTVDRDSSDASRSMVGIKADGTLVLCQVDGRKGAVSSGLTYYEMAEMMLSLGCVNAFNCDGGGSSTFVSKREGETGNTMRSIPSDGAERPTINSVILVSTAVPTGIFDRVAIESDYDYFAAGSYGDFTVRGIDTNGFAVDMPAGVVLKLSDESIGTIVDGTFYAFSKKGDVEVQAVYNGKVVGTKTVHIVDPEVFALTRTETALPYGKSMEVDLKCTYGADSWTVCMNGAYALTLSDPNAATVNGTIVTATTDETVAGVDVTVTYTADPSLTAVLKITYGKASDILIDFENGSIAGFVGIDEAFGFWQANGILDPYMPPDGYYSPEIDTNTFLSTDIVKNGKYSLGVSVDFRTIGYDGWGYTYLFYIGNELVYRDVANGNKGTTIGMWMYVPEGAAGMTAQICTHSWKADGTLDKSNINSLSIITVDGTAKTLQTCSEADIPESRWVYAYANIVSRGDHVTSQDPLSNTKREPAFIRIYGQPASVEGMMYGSNLIFYIDDITLDYSTAVDDRVLPTITDVSYATTDDSKALADNAVISGNSITFQATVADNIKLDNSTGKIYVDGVELKNVSVSGNSLTTTSDVSLKPGVHTVSFEIKDTMGNLAKVSRTFTIAGTPAVTLYGHNDSGAIPEYGSVYYADIIVADITSVDKMTVTLELQNANSWETEGIVAAKGFDVTSVIYNELHEIITVTVERNGEKLDAEATKLLSLPIRLWTYKGFNRVPDWITNGNNYTDDVFSEESVLEAGSGPIVKIDCNVLYGLINDNQLFGGTIYADTNISGNDLTNPWHFHDTELVVLNKAATGSEAGYENRTYCQTCQSVVDWGTILPALGHNYQIVDGRFVCVDANCGEVYESGTGIFEMDGALYYSVNNELKTGWQDAGDGKYCYAASNYKLVTGEKSINGVKYTFDENGATAGAWVVNATGKRYSYGPSYYRREWAEIDGKSYYFGRDSYLYTGIRYIKNNPDTDPVWYNFGEDGGNTTQDQPFGYVGLFRYNNELYYIGENGVGVMGLVEVNGDYYYFQFGEGFEHVYYAAMDKTVYVKTTNGVKFPDGTPVPNKSFYFDAEGKMVAKRGVVNGVYYENGQIVPYKGLVEYAGAYYYVNEGGKVITNQYYYTKTTNGLTFPDGSEITKRNYYFDAEGKLQIWNGVVDGVYYENSKPIAYKGLVYQDGYYYYVNEGGKVVTNKTYYAKTTNGLTFPNGAPITSQKYTFDAEGKMLLLNGVVDGVYYENNKAIAYKGLIYQDGYYYYVNEGGKVVTNKTYYAKTTNGLTFPNGAPITSQKYYFDAEGKMEVLNGIINGVYYENSKIIAYKGLVYQDGYYYYVNEGGKVVTNKTYYAKTTNGLTFPNGAPVTSQKYTFDAEGKMLLLNGIIDGVYYENNKIIAYKGLVYQDGYYYYVNVGGKVVTNRTYFVKTSNGLTFPDGTLIPNKSFAFDEEGKMVY